MIISWLYTGETASQIQEKAVWGEVPRLLAHGRIWSGHWDGGSPACEPAGTRAEVAPPLPPPHLHLLYAAQVFQIKLLFASFPWWLTQFACECFFSQDAQQGQIAGRFGLIPEIFNSPANSTRVSGFDKKKFKHIQVWHNVENKPELILSGLIMALKWGHLYPRLLLRQSCAPTRTRGRCHWINKTLNPCEQPCEGLGLASLWFKLGLWTKQWESG